MTNPTPHGQVPDALEDPSPDQLRAIARVARNSSGSASDDCGPLAYVLHGWRAAVTALRTQQPAPATQQAEVRPVTPYTCPKCHALWLHWPAEQTGFGRDTLNCRSADHCHYCEKAGVEQLQRLERIPAALHAPQPSPTAQAESVLEDAALSGEQQRAIFEAHESAASEGYFEARPQIDCNDRRRVFKAGYERGWDAARKQGGA